MTKDILLSLAFLSLFSTPVLAQECQIHFPIAKLCGSLELKEPPHSSGESEAQLKFWDENDSSSNPAGVDPEGKLNVVLWMNMGGHGHGSRPTQIQRTGTGTYQVTKMFFVMPGTWEVRVQRLEAQKLIEQSILETQVEAD